MKTLEQLAREAGLVEKHGQVFFSTTALADNWVGREVMMEDLARFRAACRAEALEEAAQVARKKANDWHGHDGKYACEDVEAAIREMK